MSPCKNCITRGGCNNICEEALEYIREIIIKCKPKNSPAAAENFIERLCKNILNESTQSIEVWLTFNNNMNSIRHIIYVEDTSIVKVKKHESM